jgi:hypothetical protein
MKVKKANDEPISVKVAKAAKLPSRKVRLPYSPGPKDLATIKPAKKENTNLARFVVSVVRYLTLTPVLFKCGNLQFNL